MSRSQIKQLITAGQLCVNLKDTDKKTISYKLKEGDIIDINDLNIKTVASNAKPNADIVFEIVYEDEALAVINKPAGLTVHPGAGNYQNTLVNGLLAKNFQLSDDHNNEQRPGIVHRLDKDTSGLMLVAKTNAAHQHLAQHLQLRRIKRIYQALAYGFIQPPAGSIDLNIGRSQSNYQKMKVVPVGGKVARTNYEIITNYSNLACLVKVQLDTGRTHQIRVHFSHLGHSLIGDQTYGKAPKILNLNSEVKQALTCFKRQALHAASISFVHPNTYELMTFDAEPPADFTNLMALLAKYYS